MLKSVTGIVYAAEGCVDLVVMPPPWTLAEAMASRGVERGLSEIIFPTGINRGPVEVRVEALPAEPSGHEPGGWDDAWEDFDLILPPGSVNLNGPGEDGPLGIGTIETPTVYRFRVYANGRGLMRDLVAYEVVENYLVQVWEPLSGPSRLRQSKPRGAWAFADVTVLDVEHQSAQFTVDHLDESAVTVSPVTPHSPDAGVSEPSPGEDACTVHTSIERKMTP